MLLPAVTDVGAVVIATAISACVAVATVTVELAELFAEFGSLVVAVTVVVSVMLDPPVTVAV